jgi:molecular chaperone DnaK
VEYYIEEPTAAALYYATDRALDGKYLVYDFGGGTFDVTLIEAHGNNIDVLYQDGVQELGGMRKSLEI